MEVKHKECFIPNIVQYFGLAAVSKYAREAAEFVNLYSQWRGINRFPGLTMTLDLLAERPEVARRGFRVPALTGLRDWLARETKLANPTLKAEVEATGDPDLALALRLERGRQPLDRRDRPRRPPLPVRPRVARGAGRQGRRDGRLGHPRRGPRPRVGRARPGATTSPDRRPGARQQEGAPRPGRRRPVRPGHRS